MNLMARSGKHRRPWWKRDKDAHSRRASTRRDAQKKLRRARRRGVFRKLGAALLVVALVAVVGAGAFGIYSLVTRDGDDSDEVPDKLIEAGPGDTISTALFFGTSEKKTMKKGALWLNLVSIDKSSGQVSVIYIPAHTAAEVPGRGLLGLGEAYSSGGVPLLLATAENLLGVQMDRYLELSDSDARVLFSEIEPLSVDVPTEVRVKAGRNKTRLLFTEGPQALSAAYVKRLLYVVGVDGDETELGSRHLAFWDGLLEQFSDDPEALGDAIKEGESAVAESDADVKELARFFEALATAPPEDRALTTLPVSQISVGGDELYEVDTETLAEFMEDTLGSEPALGDEVRVQILNGNGEPGIGEEVAARLSEEDFRVILSGNARRLDYEKTLVVTYDPSQEGQAIAERARDLIGVGEVQISGQGQGIVDLTIVVGKDFLRTE